MSQKTLHDTDGRSMHDKLSGRRAPSDQGTGSTRVCAVVCVCAHLGRLDERLDLGSEPIEQRMTDHTIDDRITVFGQEGGDFARIG